MYVLMMEGKIQSLKLMISDLSQKSSELGRMWGKKASNNKNLKINKQHY